MPFQNRRLDTIKRHWGELIQNNKACLHACICVASSDIALRTSELPLKSSSNEPFSPLLLDTFHHRGETIRLVNSGLSDPLRAASDGLIASVSMLLTIEVRVPFPPPSLDYAFTPSGDKQVSLSADCDRYTRLSEDAPSRTTSNGSTAQEFHRRSVSRTISDFMVSLLLNVIVPSRL